MRGGYREGAGRKRGFAAKNAEEARRLLSERVWREIVPISEALISKAKEGDIRAIHELFDRAWGRAPQAVQIESTNLPVPILDLMDFDEAILRKIAAEAPIYGGRSQNPEQAKESHVAQQTPLQEVYL